MAVITISRGTYSGGKALAECVAEKLGYRCIAEEILGKASQEYGRELHELEHAMLDKPGMFERSEKSRLGVLPYVRAVLCERVKGEKVVYHGHAGHFLLKDVPHVLRIRLIAGMEFRIEAAMRDRGLDRSGAIKFIHKADAAREKWTKFLFHMNLLDPALYDMEINLERTSLDGACELVCRAATEQQFQPTEASHKALEDICLKSRIEAKIAADLGFSDPGIEIEAAAGEVTLVGKLASRNADKLRELVSHETGVKKVLIHT